MANEKQPTTSASKVRADRFDWRFRGIIATLTSLFEPFYPISSDPGHSTAASNQIRRMQNSSIDVNSIFL